MCTTDGDAASVALPQNVRKPGVGGSAMGVVGHLLSVSVVQGSVCLQGWFHKSRQLLAGLNHDFEVLNGWGLQGYDPFQLKGQILIPMHQKQPGTSSENDWLVGKATWQTTLRNIHDHLNNRPSQTLQNAGAA